MFYSLLEKGWCLYFIHHRQQYLKKDTSVYIIVLSDFWWDKFLSKSIKLLSFYVSIKFVYWTRFLFHQTSINSISQSFDLFEPWILCCFPFWISSSFGASFFVLFQMQWTLVTVNKARFSLRKTVVTFSEISTMRCAVYKIEFAPWKTYSLMCRRTSAIIISFEAHGMSCLNGRNSRLEKNICHVMFLQCAWVKLHSSSLTNVEQLTSNFGHSVQIYNRGKEKTKMMAIGKSFTLHANAKKKTCWNN